MATATSLVINSRVKSETTDAAAFKSATSFTEALEDIFKVPKAPKVSKKRVGEGRYEKEVLKISDYPEFKKTTVKKCKKAFGKKICINWPQLWKRSGRISIFLVITYPKEFEKDIRDCVGFALTAAVLAALATGNLALAASTLKTALTTCLTKKGSGAIGKINVDFDTRTTHSAWKKV